MTSVLTGQVARIRVTQKRAEAMPADSLLEYFYTYFSLDQLKAMSKEHPGVVTLNRWNVTLSEYNAQLAVAIDYVIHD